MSTSKVWYGLRHVVVALLVLALTVLAAPGCGEKEEAEVTPEQEEGPAMARMPFGSDSDAALADSLWAMLSDEQTGYLTWKTWGEADVEMKEGMSPHGAYLKTYVSPDAAPAADSIPYGAIIVKENYMADTTLGPITVMWRIEGYDPDNFDWFWAKYQPNGMLDTNPQGVKLAGRVAKGMDQGCIACHSQAKGDDFAFTN